MPWIWKSFQVDKMDIPAKLPGNSTANSQGNSRFADAAGAEQCYEPLISKPVANLTDHRFTPNHRDRPYGEPSAASRPIVPALRTACERDDAADERVAPSFDVCDV